jgi:hypothetical protein
VQPAGIEPASMALQTTAMTTSAKVALLNRIAFLAFFKKVLMFAVAILKR